MRTLFSETASLVSVSAPLSSLAVSAAHAVEFVVMAFSLAHLDPLLAETVGEVQAYTP